MKVETPDEWERLARTVARVAPQLRSPRSTIKYQTLENEWKTYIHQLSAASDLLPAEIDGLYMDLEEDLKRSLGRLCEDRVMYQGYNWPCQQCAYKNWNTVDSLSMTLKCAICHETHSLPVDVKLDFRLNDFVATCLREHDTVSVLWALGYLQNLSSTQHGRHRTSFLFSPQLELFVKNEPNPYQELDLLCLFNGRLLVGEVKRSLVEITDREIEKIFIIATAVKAEIVFLGAMSGVSQQLVHKMEAARAKFGTRFELIGAIADDEPNDYCRSLP